MRGYLLSLTAALGLFLLPSHSLAASATLSWTPPQVSGVTGYRIYYSKVKGVYPLGTGFLKEVPASQTQATVTFPADVAGQVFLTVTAIVTGYPETPPGNEIAVTVPAGINHPPVLAPPGNFSIAEGELLSFVLSASDPDGNPLTYSASNLPQGAILDARTGSFIWKPIYDQAGAYSVTFGVSDGLDTANQSSSIVVSDVNRPPALSSPATSTIAEGSTLSFRVYGYDPDGDPLTYSVAGLPAGATFNIANNGFSWTPSSGQSGSYTVQFSVSDGKAAPVSRNTVITVTALNRAPVLSPVGDKSVAEGSNLSFTLSGSDPDGDALAYSATGLPSGATLTASTGAFSWTPTSVQVGNYAVTFTVSDGKLTASQAATITVTAPNRPPTLAAVGSKSVDAGSNLSFALSGSDPDGDALAYSATGLPSGATLAAATGAFSWTPTSVQVGNYAVTFTVSDGKLTASQAATITVTPQNRPPVLSAVGNRSVVAGSNLSFTLSGSDPDGDALAYSATGLPTGATLAAATGAFSWTPTSVQVGNYAVTFTVSDGKLAASQAAAIAVRAVNLPPTISSVASQTMAEDTIKTVSVTVADPDNDVNTLVVTGTSSDKTLLPDAGITISSTTATRTVTLKPAPNRNGTATVTLTVNDPGKLSASSSFGLTVTPVNDPPYLAPIKPLTLPEGSPISLQLNGSDVDGDVLTYSGRNLPKGSSLDKTTGRFTWTPTYTQAGSYTMTFSVSDGKLSVSRSVTLTVLDAQPPLPGEVQTLSILASDFLEPVSAVFGSLTAADSVDMAVLDASAGVVRIYKASSPGQFQPEAVSYTSGRPIAGRFNRPLGAPGEVLVLQDAAAGSWVLPAAPYGPFLVGQPEVPYVPTDLEAGDMDGDGLTDAVVTRAGTDDAALLLGTTEGRFIEALAVGTGTAPSAVAMADLDRDGVRDMVAANGGGTGVSVFLGSPAGNFVLRSSFATGQGPSSLALADFDRDGFPDLATANEWNGTITVALGSGTGSFILLNNYLLGPAPWIVRTGDLNGDGLADLAALDSSDKKIRTLLGVGNGTFRVGPVFTGGTSPSAFVLSDINGDGISEMVVCDTATKAVTLIRPATPIQ